MKKLDMPEVIGIIYLLIAVFIAFLNRSNISSNVLWLVITVSTVIGFIVAYLTVNIQQKHIVLLISIIIIMVVFTVYAVQNGIFWQTYGALLMGFGSGIFLLRKGKKE